MKQPSPQALEHSQLLQQKIADLIRSQGGKLSFAEFMQQALYAPGLGYYNCGATKFGAAGDFVTAPELGSLFAKCLAVQCAQILENSCGNTILEIGAGSGQLACDLILSLNNLGITLDRYLILELSAELIQRQQQKISQLCPQFLDRVQWLDQLPANPINGVILANEVMDAMPVNRFHFADNVLQEYYVTTANNNFAYELLAPSTPLQRAFEQQNLSMYLESGEHAYSSEINLWLPAWIKSLSHSLNTGAILLFDYGFPRAEYYHPQRDSGTLMCHYQHYCHADPFWYPGIQDITAHVDFSTIAIAATACDLNLSGYTNLASFLINCEITKQSSVPLTVQQAQEFNTLTSPAEMGELFKASCLTKHISDSLVGFAQFDKRYSLEQTSHKP